MLCLYWVVDIVDDKRFELRLSELIRLFSIFQRPDMRVVVLLNKCNECEEYEQNLTDFLHKFACLKFQDVHIETLNALYDSEDKIKFAIDKHVIDLIKTRYTCLNEYNTKGYISSEVENVLSEAEYNDPVVVLEKNRSAFLF